MRCTRCNILAEEVRLYRTTGTGRSGIRLCRHCADELMIPVNNPELPLRDQDILEGLLDDSGELRCRECGRSDVEVTESGLLGCEGCLDAFGDQLADRLIPLTARIKHAVGVAPYHVGSLPPALADFRQTMRQIADPGQGPDRQPPEGEHPPESSPDPAQSPHPAGPPAPDQQPSATQPSHPAGPSQLHSPALSPSAPQTDSFAWFDGSGPAGDVVLCSRAVYSRSLQPIPLQQGMQREIAEQYLQLLTDHTSPAGLPGTGGMLNAAENAILRERFLLDHSDDQPQAQVSTNGREVLLGGREDLRCVTVAAGLQLNSVLAQQLMDRIDEHLPVRARIDFGYIPRTVRGIGEGLQLSAVLQLWGLDAFGLTRTVINENCPENVTWRQLPGSMVHIATGSCLGITRQQLTELLEGCIVALVHYERTARTDLLQQRPEEWRQRLRELLQHAVQLPGLGFDTAVRLLGDLRIGGIAGFWPGIHLNELTRLMVCVQDAHVRQLFPDEQQLDQARKSLVLTGVRSILQEEQIDV
ncbi:arginine kinase [Spirochaeta africana]|uniref:Arginine kinase n=1 Tax=Spirochaeta africana (strain ATCC 700263 / DSM 8902 / Z-7692) TaxID=889378 RepID=H9UI07_SPIAZ|nr:arginine kinase [Spirochaeta africana]AFG37150.1 arginine kinase [Spirochaeta africana DSM 8902]